MTNLKTTIIVNEELSNRILREAREENVSQFNSISGIAKMKRRYQEENLTGQANQKEKIEKLERLERFHNVYTYGGKSWKVLSKLIEKTININNILRILKFIQNKNNEINPNNKEVSLYFVDSNREDLIFVDEKNCLVVVVSTKIVEGLQ